MIQVVADCSTTSVLSQCGVHQMLPLQTRARSAMRHSAGAAVSMLKHMDAFIAQKKAAPTVKKSTGL